jgi:hypothetical protein
MSVMIFEPSGIAKRTIRPSVVSESNRSAGAENHKQLFSLKIIDATTIEVIERKRQPLDYLSAHPTALNFNCGPSLGIAPIC